MKIIYIYVLICLFIPNVYGLSDWQFPVSRDPKEFEREVERLISTSSERGIGVGGPERQEQQAAINKDLRDWESVLAKIIGNPGKFGLKECRIAFSIAQIRKTETRPEIVDALIGLFHAHVADALDKIRVVRARGEEIPDYDTVQLKAFTEDVLQVEDPRILQAVLVYMNSEDDGKVDQISGFTPQYVASALRKYGDSTNLAEAGKFANRLKEIGKK